MLDIRQTLRLNFISNILQVIIVSGLIFFTYKIIISKIGASDFGVWSVVLATVSFSKIVDFGFGDSVTKFVSLEYSRNNYKEISSIIQTPLITICFFFILFCPIAYLTFGYLLKLLFSSNELNKALLLLPFSLAAFLLSILSSLLQSALEGCDKTKERTIIVVVSQLLYLLVIFALISEYGLLALAWAQIFQFLFIIVFAWFIIRKNVIGVPLFPSRWSKRVFKYLFEYGLNLQVSSIIMMLFDPFTKGMLIYFGNSMLVSYFEISNQIIQKARNLIVFSNKGIIPAVSKFTSSGNFNTKDVYLNNLKLIIVFSLLLYSILFIASSWFQLFYFTINDIQFLFFFKLLVIAWAINTINVSAFYVNLGIGTLKDNTVSALIIGFLNLILNPLISLSYAENGPIISYCISLILGSLYLFFVFNKKNHISFNEIFDSKIKAISVFTIIYILICTYLNIYLIDKDLLYFLLLLFSLTFILYVIYLTKNELFMNSSK